MTDKVTKIIYKREMRNMIVNLKQIGLSSNGIIFGGLVRDEIIGTYYSKLFKSSNKDFSKFWDMDYDLDTIRRIIIPNDMDIYFHKIENKNIFVDKLNNFAKLFNGNVTINQINSSSTFKEVQYNLSQLVDLKQCKIFVDFNIGRTMTTNGIKLKFNIDVVYNVNLIEGSVIEPPFNNLDFTSNMFIMENVCGKQFIRISNCTGTKLDNMTFYLKHKYIASITNDIINMRTQFVRRSDSAKCEYINSYRIIKMMSRSNKWNWNITNLIFKIKLQDEVIFNDTSCCICLDSHKSDKYIVLNKSIYHYDCFTEYLIRENAKKYRNSKGEIECKCPLRNKFNFKDCYKLIDYI